MLLDLKAHMAKRKLYDIFPTKQVAAEESKMQTCRICTLCYQFIVQENQLIKVILLN